MLTTARLTASLGGIDDFFTGPLNHEQDAKLGNKDKEKYILMEIYWRILRDFRAELSAASDLTAMTQALKNFLGLLELNGERHSFKPFCAAAEYMRPILGYELSKKEMLQAIEARSLGFEAWLECRLLAGKMIFDGVDSFDNFSRQLSAVMLMLTTIDLPVPFGRGRRIPDYGSTETPSLSFKFIMNLLVGIVKPDLGRNPDSMRVISQQAKEWVGYCHYVSRQKTTLFVKEAEHKEFVNRAEHKDEPVEAASAPSSPAPSS